MNNHRYQWVITVYSYGGALLERLRASTEAEHLRVAKKDAFDSVLALTQARAVSYDANADESRYLIDPDRAAKLIEHVQKLS